MPQERSKWCRCLERPVAIVLCLLVHTILYFSTRTACPPCSHHSPCFRIDTSRVSSDAPKPQVLHVHSLPRSLPSIPVYLRNRGDRGRGCSSRRHRVECRRKRLKTPFHCRRGRAPHTPASRLLVGFGKDGGEEPGDAVIAGTSKAAPCSASTALFGFDAAAVGNVCPYFELWHK